MGEYVKLKGKEVKIGTCENLYYVTYDKLKKALEEREIAPALYSVHPADCLKVDSGFLFRFPFPDEDNLPFGDIGKFSFERGVPVTIIPKGDKDLMELKEPPIDKEFTIDIIRQKLVHRISDGEVIFALVFREPVSRDAFRIEEDRDMLKIVKQIVSNNILKEPEIEKRQFYRQLVIRILKGYRIRKQQIEKKEVTVHKTEQSKAKRIKRPKL